MQSCISSAPSAQRCPDPVPAPVVLSFANIYARGIAEVARARPHAAMLCFELFRDEFRRLEVQEKHIRPP